MALSDADRELLELQRSQSRSGAGPAGLPSGAAVAADPEVIRTWELRQAAQREAYGQYVADGDIYIGNAMTFTHGQPVPLEHVIRFNLVERNQVNRVATPELARMGRVFDTDEEFLKANPRLLQRRGLEARGELHPSALDPRGGAAEIDEARKRGEDVPEPTQPGDRTEARQAKVDEAAENLPGPDDADSGDGGDDSGGKGSGGKSRARRPGGDKGTGDRAEAGKGE